MDFLRWFISELTVSQQSINILFVIPDETQPTFFIRNTTKPTGEQIDLFFNILTGDNVEIFLKMQKLNICS